MSRIFLFAINFGVCYRQTMSMFHTNIFSIQLTVNKVHFVLDSAMTSRSVYQVFPLVERDGTGE